AREQERGALAELCDRYAADSQSGLSRVLNGPTGERNSYLLLPRERVLSLADSEADRLCQLAAGLAVGNHLFWPDSEENRTLRGALPRGVQDRISLVRDWSGDAAAFDAVMHHGDAEQLRDISLRIARRDGPIIPVIGLPTG